MDGERQISVGLELKVGNGSISGLVTDGAGSQRTFTGWLGLLAALDELSTTGRLSAGSFEGTQGGVA